MKLNPLVSVVLPVYNSDEYLLPAVMSFMAQTYNNLEIIAIDDGSTDNSLSILELLSARDPRISLISRENRGLVATLNEGISAARGHLIARMDSDDIAYADRIQRQVATFEASPELCLVGMHADFLFPGNRVLKSSATKVSQHEIRIKNIFDGFFIHPSVMLNKLLLSDELYYDNKYIHSEDFDLWRRITTSRPVAFINEPGLAWRQGHNSIRKLYFKEQCVSHARIVGEQLEFNQIIADREVLLSAIARGNLDDAMGVVDIVRKFVAELRADRHVFESALASFVSWLFSALVQNNRPHEIVIAMQEVGVASFLAPRDRLLASFSRRLPGGLALETVERTRNISRYLRSIPLDRASKFPNVVAEAIRKPHQLNG